jgi:three-Cys-motif partner protein
MASQSDRAHFEDYRAQTEVKHNILEDYLLPYFQIVGKANDTLLYVDGFAGPGSYRKANTGEEFDGSPLRALKVIARDKNLAQKVKAVFIEIDEQLYSRLASTVNSFAAINAHIHKPKTLKCPFADGIDSLLSDTHGKLPPTFLFVDPCGVAGANFEAIKAVMGSKSSEAFIFFNIDGIRRIAGLTGLSNVLIELFGSQRRAEHLFSLLQNTSDVGRRERQIINSYRDALREDMGVRFSIPFRVEAEEKQKTSHYLIHATNHHLGFKIMKEVMWAHGQSQTGQGELQFVQASGTGFYPLFDPRTPIKEEILNALASGPKRVSLFCQEWIVRPEDLQTGREYRNALLELEAANQVEVLDKGGLTLKPANKRPKRDGKPTLGEDYFVQLPARRV